MMIDFEETLGFVRLVHAIKELKQQNVALVEALEFYADEDKYTGWTDPDYQWTGQFKDYPSPIEGDMGEIARQALAEGKQG